MTLLESMYTDSLEYIDILTSITDIDNVESWLTYDVTFWHILALYVTFFFEWTHTIIFDGFFTALLIMHNALPI